MDHVKKIEEEQKKQQIEDPEDMDENARAELHGAFNGKRKPKEVVVHPTNGLEWINFRDNRLKIVEQHGQLEGKGDVVIGMTYDIGLGESREGLSREVLVQDRLKTAFSLMNQHVSTLIFFIEACDCTHVMATLEKEELHKPGGYYEHFGTMILTHDDRFHTWRQCTTIAVVGCLLKR